jgi:hypothetical protein
LDLFGTNVNPSCFAALQTNMRLRQSLRHVNICGISTSLVVDSMISAPNSNNNKTANVELSLPSLQTLSIDGCQPSMVRLINSHLPLLFSL